MMTRDLLTSRMFVLLIFLTVFLSTGAVFADDDDNDEDRDHEQARLQIKEAKWESDHHKLVVKGKGANAKGRVTIRDQGDHSIIGQVTANKKGKWKFRKRHLEQVPCAVLAQSGEDSLTRKVADAPADCGPAMASNPTPDPEPTPGGNQPPTPTPLPTPTPTPGTGVTEQPFVNNGGLAVFPFNDLGMHCADMDYTVFATLPPFNNMNVQVIERGRSPKILDDSQTDVVISAASNPNDPVSRASGVKSINSTSQLDKTNFWDNVFALFGASPPPDEGLLGMKMPGILDPGAANDPQVLRYNAGKTWFSAEGMPAVWLDDAGQTNAYPVMRLQASKGGQTATTDAVMPVAAEATCDVCHALEGDKTSVIDSHPGYDPQFASSLDAAAVLDAAKRNILALHDAKHGTYLTNQTPVLCASCHYSAALDLAGNGGPTGNQVGHDYMSKVMHGFHAETGAFDENSLDDSCYLCHPGKQTQCLRGAMANAGLVCTNCHGGLAAVGNAGPAADLRKPWLDEPACESCHVGDASSGHEEPLKQAYQERFVANSTAMTTTTPNPVVTPRFAADTSGLYRMSFGHEGVACAACHGSPHTIWPHANPNANDNLTALQLQGHVGTIVECTVCHAGGAPMGLEGPHGMHPVDDPRWSKDHEDFFDRRNDNCAACHGADHRGTRLSEAHADRTYKDDSGKTLATVKKGDQVGCGLCHSIGKSFDD